MSPTRDIQETMVAASPVTTKGYAESVLTGDAVSLELVARLAKPVLEGWGRMRQHPVLALAPTDTVVATAQLEAVFVQRVREMLAGQLPVQTFYNPSAYPELTAGAVLRAVPAFVAHAQLDAEAVASTYVQQSLSSWLRATASTPVEGIAQYYSELLLSALAVVSSTDAFATLVQEAVDALGTDQAVYAVAFLDTVAAALVPEATLAVELNELLEGQAGDTVEALGRYLANVKSAAGAWVTFKVSGEVVQGWVVNVEGDNPISQYEGFEFNSMTRIGDSYFGAADQGLYRLDGDTDAGEPIAAHIRTMMLDFDSTSQKRVVAAYLGYTSEGPLVLKVRSVDDGRLVEHWYEAKDVVADAPRAGYKPLGRGLKSRYWQFELSNKAGGDFELDKLELYPIQLNRRT